ncbi:hypothetical protein KVV02_008153 [Mortierella alpina]|uniref:Endonuclease/exonuclease/phosphatase domain-containing protein n=1 Tax=Mortierella alpina TaxID=64518 RepID=A0A9P8CUW6_MORAP|nr:hypothetical protein KVV02_008153 [Mortierella alpina]
MEWRGMEQERRDCVFPNELGFTADRCRPLLRVPSRPQSTPHCTSTMRTRLLDKIAAYNPDVVCVQELDKSDDYDGDFCTRMIALGYDGHIFKTRNNAVEHGFAILYKNNRATFVSDCPIPFPQGIVEGVDHPGIMLVFDAEVATARLVSEYGPGMALLSAAKALIEKNRSMAFIFTGDFNAHLGDFLIEYILSGSADLAQMPLESRKRLFKASDSLLRGFKIQTQALRDVLSPPTSVSKAEKSEEQKAKTKKQSQVKELSVAEKQRTMIKSHKDLMDMAVSHPMHTASVYSLATNIDLSSTARPLGAIDWKSWHASSSLRGRHY